MKLPGPISNREVVAVNTTKVVGDKAYCGNRSCNFPVQLNKDNVLAEIHAAGFILERVGDKTKVTNISDVDVKGSIPGFVKNAMAGKRAEMMKDLENTIRKNLK
jgi:thiamine monophosphate kinase